MSIINEGVQPINLPPTKPTQTRLWEIWPGKQQFFYKGKLLSGPRSDRIHSSFAYSLLLLLPFAEILLTTSYLWVHVTPILPIVTIYLWIGSILLSFLITFSDPGVIPRRFIFTMFGEVPAEYSLGTPTADQAKKPRFCKTCEIYRPRQSHHCSLCDSCIDHFDHHCRYLNNCIGSRNYRFFVALVVHLAFLGINLIDNLILFVFYDEGPTASNERCLFKIHENSVVIVILVILGLATLAVTVLVWLLCLFHMSLCYNGKTT